MTIDVTSDSNNYVVIRVTSAEGDTVDSVKAAITSLRELLPKTEAQPQG